MKLDAGKQNTNPIVACADFSPKMESDYTIIGGATEEYVLQYLTDASAVRDLLPEPYTPGEKPVITVLHTWLDGSNVVYGGDYALSSVLVSARFDGEVDHKDGHYAFVMPENNNYAVHSGRDSSGAAKIFADLPRPYTLANGHTRCETRVWNYDKGAAQWQVLYGVDFAPMQEADKATTQQWNAALDSFNVFNLKWIFGVEGGCDVTYPAYFGFKREFEQCWVGKSGEFYLGQDIYEGLVLENRLVDAFKKLPVREVLGTVRWRSQMTMGQPGTSGRLR